MDIESPQCGILKSSSYARQISSSSSRYSEKKLRKRKELDAMLRNKQRPGRSPGGSVHRRHELLRDICSDESSSSEESGYFRSSSRGGKSGSCSSSGPEGKQLLSWRKNCVHGLCLVTTLLASLIAIITVIWLHLQMNINVDRFRSQLESVLEERKLANDNHHRYHTQIQELVGNQTLLAKNITLLYELYHNYSSHMTKLDSSVNTIVKNLKSAPELKTLPKDIEDAKKNLAKFGSHLTNLDTRVSELETKLTHNVVEMTKTLNRTLEKRDDDYYESILRKLVQEKVRPLQEDIKHIDEYRRIFATNITEQLKAQEINFAQNLKLMNNLEDNMRNITQASNKHQDEFEGIHEVLQEYDEKKSNRGGSP